MREQAGAIRRELGLLFQDVERFGTCVENLDRHCGQAAKALSEIKISSDKAGRWKRRLDNFDFEELHNPEVVAADQEGVSVATQSMATRLPARNWSGIKSLEVAAKCAAEPPKILTARR